MSPVTHHDARTRCDICFNTFKNVHYLRLHRARCVEVTWGMNRAWWQRKARYPLGGKMQKKDSRNFLHSGNLWRAYLITRLGENKLCGALL